MNAPFALALTLMLSLMVLVGLAHSPGDLARPRWCRMPPTPVSSSLLLSSRLVPWQFALLLVLKRLSTLRIGSNLGTLKALRVGPSIRDVGPWTLALWTQEMLLRSGRLLNMLYIVLVVLARHRHRENPNRTLAILDDVDSCGVGSSAGGSSEDSGEACMCSIA